jgi:hypothetical protein
MTSLSELRSDKQFPCNSEPWTVFARLWTRIDYLLHHNIIHVTTFWVTRWGLGVWLAEFWSSSQNHTWQRYIFLNAHFRDIFSKLAGFWLFFIIEMQDVWTLREMIICMQYVLRIIYVTKYNIQYKTMFFSSI